MAEEIECCYQKMKFESVTGQPRCEREEFRYLPYKATCNHARAHARVQVHAHAPRMQNHARHARMKTLKKTNRISYENT